MANIASHLSNQAIFTSDNPRTEDPETILEEMEAGVSPENYKKNDLAKSLLDAYFKNQGPKASPAEVRQKLCEFLEEYGVTPLEPQKRFQEALDELPPPLKDKEDQDCRSPDRKG